MAEKAVEIKGISVRLACQLFQVSQSCYRYEPKLSDENALVADWLLRLTYANKKWGFGLCFLYLRNIKGFGWNHKRGSSPKPAVNSDSVSFGILT